MNSADRLVLGTLPEPVVRTLLAFENAFQAKLRLLSLPSEPGAASEVLYASAHFGDLGAKAVCSSVTLRQQSMVLELQIGCDGTTSADAVSAALTDLLSQAWETAREIQFFTYELSERFEEINLLYSISETLGSTLDLEDGAPKILGEVRDVMGAKRGSLWVHSPEEDALHLVAQVGEGGRPGPVSSDDPDAITSMVFREGRAIIATRRPTAAERDAGGRGDSFLSVPIRYSPGSGESKTVGVINLIGRVDDERFNASNQKLLSAIASQVGAALENNRLVRQSLSRERMAREMELAHDLQMKLLPSAERFEGATAAARVEPTEQVGGDFYQLFRLSGGRIGVMLGDVSLHGFASALIMTLTMSAAGICAREADSPAEVLRGLDDALGDELESTEMFVTVFYGVLDPTAGTLVYANAGHPHAFAIHADGTSQRLGATDPPMGFAGPDSFQERRLDWDQKGDLLLLFTDGLSDSLTSTARGGGERQVLSAAVAHRFSSPTDVVSALFGLESDSGRTIIGDDRTALVLRV